MKTLICHNCGGELVRGSRISKYKDRTEQIVRCLQCNSEFDQYSGEYYKEFIDNFIFDKDSSVLEVGLKGSLRNTEYEIVGRVRYQDESVAAKSTWDEWVLKASNGEFACIIEENDRIYFYQEYKSGSINISKSEQKHPSIEFNNEAVKAIIPYTGRIVLIEGDIACKAEIGCGVQFYDFKRYGENYTLKRCNKIDKFLSGERLLLSEIINSFNIKKFQEASNRMNRKWISLKQEGRIYAVCMVISIILSAYNCFGGIPIKGVMNSKKVLSENLIMTGDNKVYESQILYGTFPVTEKDKLYNVSVGIADKKFSGTDILSFRLMLIEENRLIETSEGKTDAASLKDVFDRIDALIKPVESYAVSGYIYSADAEYAKEFNFAVDESGKYYFYLELFSKDVIDIDSIIISMSKKDSSIYYAITAFIFLLLCGICIKYSRYYKEFTKNEIS